MKVFVTGATGFIGSHVVRLLVSQECTVYALLRPGSNTWRINDLLPSIKIIQGSLTGPEELGKQLKEIKPEIALHLAWYAVPSDYLTSFQNIPLVEASVNLATQLAQAGCKKLVAAGTCFEYDTASGYLSEESPKNPQTLYAACKLGLYLMLEQLSPLIKMPLAWLRFFYLYGPMENESRLIRSVILSLLKDEAIHVSPGEQIRDFLHIEDVASAIWNVAKSNLTGPVNVGSGQPVSVREIATKVGVMLNKLQLIQFGARPYGKYDPMFVCANNSKLREDTSWTPRFRLEEGLHQTIQYWASTLKTKAFNTP